MRTRITKNIGGITDRYWAHIIYNTDEEVTQIQLKKLTGGIQESREVTFTMDGQEAVDLIKDIERELK